MTIWDKFGKELNLDAKQKGVQNNGKRVEDLSRRKKIIGT